MIRLVQRKLILPRGDTGSFTIPVLPDFNAGDVAVFAIFNPLNKTIVFKKQVEIADNKITIQFSHNDTVNLPTGKYLWDIKAYLNPEYADGKLVNGDQIDSYYASYKLPECQIRETADDYLMADDAPTSTLSSAQLDLLSAILAELRDAVQKSQENVTHYPTIIDNYWHIWDANTGEYVNTDVKAGGVVVEGTGVGSAKTIDFSYEAGGVQHDATQVASGIGTFAEGINTIASGRGAHAQGDMSEASGINAHAEGLGTKATNHDTHAEGYYTQATGLSSHAEGSNTVASSNNSHAEGDLTVASNDSSHAEGSRTKASGNKSHAEGIYSTASGNYSHAENYQSEASGENSHAEGYISKATKNSAHAEGYRTEAKGNYSHSEGYEAVVTGDAAHAEGRQTSASKANAHAEGFHTQATNNNTHAQGYFTVASGLNSHAQGELTNAVGKDSHAEGYYTYANGIASHSEGYATVVNGNYSHADGYYTIASGNNQYVSGKYNIEDLNNLYAVIVGIGTYNNNRLNGYTLDWSGNGWYAGKVSVTDTTPVFDTDLTSKLYVDTMLALKADIQDIPDISGKADKVSNATSGNFASLDANGNLVDSGHKHSDYLTEHQDISGKQDKLTFDDSPQMISDNPVKSSGLWSAFNSVNSDITFINSQISYLQSQVIGKQDLLYFDTQPKVNSSHPVTSGGIKTAIDTAVSTKQDTLTFDAIPTQSSNNPVTSAGIKSALSGLEWSLSERANMIDGRVDDLQNDIAGHTMDIALLESNITTLETNKQDKLTFDNTPTANSANPVTSGGIYRAITNIKTMGIHICTSQEYNSQTGIPTVASPDTKTFYLVPGGEGNNLYIEWVYVNNAWQQFGGATIDLSDYALLSDIPSNVSAFTNDAGYLTQHQDITGKQDVLTFDSVPTINSTNPVVSNGIYTAIDNVIKIQETQPVDPNTKLWIHETSSQTVQVPTVSEVEDMISNAGYLTQHQDISGKADKSNTVLNTTLSRGRSENSIVGTGSFAFGMDTVASGAYSHAEGQHTTASYFYSHAEGSNTRASGSCAHAEGAVTTASGSSAHSEGMNTTASGSGTHAEGMNTTASGRSAHAEGEDTTVQGNVSHAEGANTEASGNIAHAEGTYTEASGLVSHAEGAHTTASGDYSHAEGTFTIAAGDIQHVSGKYNIQDLNNKYAEIVGIGTYDNARANGRTLDWSGNAQYAGKVSVGNAIPTEDNDLTSKEYVDGMIDQAISDSLIQGKYKTISNQNIITFDDAPENVPLKDVIVNIEPIQDLHGYDNPWPAGGGVNILDPNLKFTTQTVRGVTLTTNDGYIYSLSGTGESGSGNIQTNSIPTANCPVYPAGTYTVIGLIIGTYHTDGSWYSNRGGTFTSDEPFIIRGGYKEIANGRTYNENSFIALVKGSTALTAWTPYSNICPITGWTGARVTRTGKNLFDKSEYMNLVSNYDYVDSSYLCRRIQLKPNTTYTVSFSAEAASSGVIALINKYSQVNISGFFDLRKASDVKTYTTDDSGCLYIGVYHYASDISYNNRLNECEIQIEVGSFATTYEPYQGASYDITFPSEAGTVYGGTLNVTDGILTVDRATVDLGTLSWNRSTRDTTIRIFSSSGLASTAKDMKNNWTFPPNFICSMYKTVTFNTAYAGETNGVISIAAGNHSLNVVDINFSDYSAADVKSALSGVQLVYELETPIIYTLTPQEITALLSLNHIWSNCGNTSVTYASNVKAYVDAVVPTKLSDLTDDSGHYIKPTTGIPANDLENGIIPTIITNSTAQEKTAIRTAIGAENGDDIIKVQDTQPTTEATKIWMPQTMPQGIQVPTVAQVDQKIAAAMQDTNGIITNATGDWLEEHIDTSTGYVIDNTLAVANAAADAKKTGDEIGDLKSTLTGVYFSAESGKVASKNLFDKNSSQNVVGEYWALDGTLKTNQRSTYGRSHPIFVGKGTYKFWIRYNIYGTASAAVAVVDANGNLLRMNNGTVDSGNATATVTFDEPCYIEINYVTAYAERVMFCLAEDYPAGYIGVAQPAADTSEASGAFNRADSVFARSKNLFDKTSSDNITGEYYGIDGAHNTGVAAGYCVSHLITVGVGTYKFTLSGGFGGNKAAVAVFDNAGSMIRIIAATVSGSVGTFSVDRVCNIRFNYEASNANDIVFCSGDMWDGSYHPYDLKINNALIDLTGQIEKEDTTFFDFVGSDNLLDNSDPIMDKYFEVDSSAGSLSTFPTANTVCSFYVRLDGAGTYSTKADKSVYGAANAAKICLFNANKELIEVITGTLGEGSDSRSMPFTFVITDSHIQSGGTYVGLAVAYKYAQTTMLVKSSTYPAEYIPYVSYWIIPDIVVRKEQVPEIDRSAVDLTDSVSKEDTTFIDHQKSVNLLDLSDPVIGQYFNQNNGTLTDLRSRVLYSFYVKLDGAGDYVTRVSKRVFGTAATKLVLFDANKSYVASVTGTLSDDADINSVQNNFTITDSHIQQGAVYVGLTVEGEYLYTTMLVKSGTYPSSYTPYVNKWIIPDLSVIGGQSLEYTPNPLYGKKIVFDGDSICAWKTDTGHKGAYAGRIAFSNSMIMSNYAVGGGTLTSGLYSADSSARHWVSGTIDTIYAKHPDADFIIFEGGTNDADVIGSILNGNIPEKYGSYDAMDFSGNYDDETFCGAVETIIFKALSYWPKSKVGFVIAPKMGYSGASYQNRRAYFQTIMDICKKWGVPYINLWDLCGMNPRLAAFYDNSKTPEENAEAGNAYLDGQHPTPTGYDIIAPIIEAWLRTI